MADRSLFRRFAFPVLAPAIAVSVLVPAESARAQVEGQGYQEPSRVLVDIVDAAPTPSIKASPDKEWMLLMQSPSLPPIADLARRELRIAGTRIAPQTNGPSRSRDYVDAWFKRVADGREIRFAGLPADPRLGDFTWSPNGERVTFTHTTDSAIELWVADRETGAAKRLTERPLNTVIAGGPQWMSDSETVLVTLVPMGRGTEPAAPVVPTGPTVQQNIGKTAPAPTYQDLLEEPHDGELFEYYATVRLAAVSLDGSIAEIGEPGIIGDFSSSPDGSYVLVERIQRPFSYLVPWYRFPTRIEVLDMNGDLVHRVADLPLQEEVPVTRGSVPTGPRSVSWRADAPATLYWVEALDGGDAGKPADQRDRVFLQAAPFADDPRPVITLGYRLRDIHWSDDRLALVTESWWRTRQTRVWRFEPADLAAEPRLVIERSYEDRYNDPGRPVMKTNASGRDVLLTADGGRALFMAGMGASPEGDRPFLDRFDLETGNTERLFRSEAPYYEQVVDVLDERRLRILTVRESQEDPPNVFVRDLGREQVRQITEFPNPTPQLIGMQKELIQYERPDGVTLSGTLYLPAGYDPERDGTLPLFVWAYPREFKTASAAAQVIGSPYEFTRLGGWSTPIWVALGYAVLDGATMPIVGEGDEEPNDTYVEQLVASAEAALDTMVQRGIAEPGRAGIGGHSYGAFMAANVLTWSDAYSAGIARSGAYNRSLTPFGFQAEDRTFWEAPEVYFRMSPFMNADKLNEPILLIHGEADNNSGTFPIQSDRYYHALKGQGKTARLVTLPHESHGYRSRESILHMLWEMEAWLERYVKRGPGDVSTSD
jgi:dipeptidyl aminopeptidase/acylaminoacyl peptidase